MAAHRVADDHMRRRRLRLPLSDERGEIVDFHLETAVAQRVAERRDGTEHPRRVQARVTVGNQGVLLRLTDKGASRQEAYEAVQRAAMKTWQGTDSLATNLRAEPFITENLTDEEITAVCSIDQHFRWVDRTFEKLGLV